MTPLRQRMLNDMTVRGLAENTKKSYLSSVTGLARHYRRSPDRVLSRTIFHRTTRLLGRIVRLVNRLVRQFNPARSSGW